MSRIVNPTAHQEREWRRWVNALPPHVAEVARRFDPWSLYRMRSTGHRVTIASFGEAPEGMVTLTVVVSGEFNAVLFERQVFGIDPADLDPCDPPNEPTGTLLTPEDVESNIDVLRVAVRPDL